MIKAPKRPNPLQDLFEMIEKGQITKTVEYENKVYTFRSLNDEDISWRDQFVNLQNPLSMSSSIKSPTLAIATVAIDGIPVEEIDSLLEMEESVNELVKKEAQENPKYLCATNLLNKVYCKLSPKYIEKLYELYNGAMKPVAEIKGEDLKNS